MADLLILGGFTLAGYVLAVYTWPQVRTFLVGAEQELVWLKARAAEIENKIRDALGGRG
jgi:hypothetical protein